MRWKKWAIGGIILLAAVSIVYVSWYLLSGEKKRIVVEEIEQKKEKEVAEEIRGKEAFPQDLYSSLGVERIDPPFEAKDFALRNLTGSILNLKDFQGKVVFLNFWASWCGPCRAEMPAMELLWQTFQDDNFVILAVNLREGKDKISSFVQTNGYTFPVLLDSQGKTASTYGVRAIPTTFLIDAQGKVVGKVLGTREWTGEDALNLIKHLLKKKTDTD